MYFKGQGHLVILAQGLSDGIKCFSLEAAGPNEVIFHVEPAHDRSMNL